MSREQDWVDVQVEYVVRQTDLAFLFRVDGVEVWVPKSQLRWPEDYSVGDHDVAVTMSEWIADQKGFEW